MDPAAGAFAAHWRAATSVFAILADQFFDRIKFRPRQWLTGVNATRA
jgi:hypothetical protein